MSVPLDTVIPVEAQCELLLRHCELDGLVIANGGVPRAVGLLLDGIEIVAKEKREKEIHLNSYAELKRAVADRVAKFQAKN